MIDFHTVYERHAADLHRFALYLTGNPALADDLVADAFVRLWTASGGIRTDTVRAYLIAIVRNLYLNSRRRVARDVPLDDTHVVADVAAPIDARIEHRETLARVRATLASFAEIDRSALLLRALHESCAPLACGGAITASPRRFGAPAGAGKPFMASFRLLRHEAPTPVRIRFPVRPGSGRAG